MGLHRILMMQGPPLQREQHSIEDDAYPWIISHRLFPIALLSQDQYWCDEIAQELSISVDVVRKIVSDEGGRV